MQSQDPTIFVSKFKLLRKSCAAQFILDHQYDPTASLIASTLPQASTFHIASSLL